MQWANYRINKDGDRNIKVRAALRQISKHRGRLIGIGRAHDWHGNVTDVFDSLAVKENSVSLSLRLCVLAGDGKSPDYMSDMQHDCLFTHFPADPFTQPISFSHPPTHREEGAMDFC